MRVVDQCTVNNGKKTFTTYKESATGVHVFIETTYSKMGGIKTKITQAHATECERLMDKAKQQMRRSAATKERAKAA